MAPPTIAIFPLPNVIFFPGTYLPLHIFEPRYRLMIEYCSESNNELAVAPLLPNKWKNKMILDDIFYKFGWERIIQKKYLPDGRSNIILEGMGIVELLEYNSYEPFRIGHVRELPRIQANHEGEIFKDLLDEIINLTKRLIEHENSDPVFFEMLKDIHKFNYPIDFLISLLTTVIRIRQCLLEEIDEMKRAEFLKNLLTYLNN